MSPHPRFAAFITALVALAIAAVPAAAKQIDSMLVCGAAGCTDITRTHEERSLDFGFQPVGPPAPAPYYRIRVNLGDGYGESIGNWSMLFVPSAGMVRTPGNGRTFEWYALSRKRLAELRRATLGVAPYPASRRAWSARRAASALPPARVVETYAPASAREAPAPRTSTAGVIGVGAAVLLVASAGVVLFLRRRRSRAHDPATRLAACRTARARAVASGGWH